MADIIQLIIELALLYFIQTGDIQLAEPTTVSPDEAEQIKIEQVIYFVDYVLNEK